jgi:uncharacterized protein
VKVPRRFWALLVGGVALIAAGANQRALLRAGNTLAIRLRTGIQRRPALKIPMRDGTRLNATLYLPPARQLPIPAILIRTTYRGVDFSRIRLFASHGYAVLVESVRGRYDSEGQYRSPYFLTKEDGADTIDWIVSQPWSNKKVGTFGCSYLGESQIMLASARHPNHIAMIAAGAGGAIGKAKNNYGYFGVFENGVLNQASALGWFTAEGRTDQRIPKLPDGYPQRVRNHARDLPVADLGRAIVGARTGFDDFTRRRLTDPWWDEQGYIGPDDQFSVATLHVNSWYDQTVKGTFDLAELMEANSADLRAKSQHVLIDPGLHCHSDEDRGERLKVGELEFAYRPLDFDRIYLDWFDHWLKGEAKPLPPKYRFFVINANEWRTSEVWPPAGTGSSEFYLGAGTLGPQPDSEPHTFQYDYDPADPVPSRGGAICCTYDDTVAGAVEQSSLARRSDVVSFASDPLANDLEIVGNPSARLFVSTDGPDTDFTVKLLDIFPDGRAFNIQDGVIRLRYRNGIAQPALATPGEIYEIAVNLRPVAFRIQRGHRLGLQVSSSNFPRLARNLNTGEDEYLGARSRVAHNRILTGAGYPSRLLVPGVAAILPPPLQPTR